jgi:hypothetical protein
MLNLTCDRAVRVGRLFAGGFDEFIGELDRHSHDTLQR